MCGWIPSNAKRSNAPGPLPRNSRSMWKKKCAWACSPVTRDSSKVALTPFMCKALALFWAKQTKRLNNDSSTAMSFDAQSPLLLLYVNCVARNFQTWLSAMPPAAMGSAVMPKETMYSPSASVHMPGRPSVECSSVRRAAVRPCRPCRLSVPPPDHLLCPDARLFIRHPPFRPPVHPCTCARRMRRQLLCAVHQSRLGKQ